VNLNRKVKTTDYSVEDLEPDVEYEFRVSAENSIKTSEPIFSSPLKYGQSALWSDTREILAQIFFDEVAKLLLKLTCELVLCVCVGARVCAVPEKTVPEMITVGKIISGTVFSGIAHTCIKLTVIKQTSSN